MRFCDDWDATENVVGFGFERGQTSSWIHAWLKRSKHLRPNTCVDCRSSTCGLFCLST